MKLVTYKVTDVTERVGVLTERAVVDLQMAARDAGISEEPFCNMNSLLSGGDTIIEQAKKLAASPSAGSLVSLSNVPLLPPPPQPRGAWFLFPTCNCCLRFPGRGKLWR